jgi:hypothetical protein
MEMRVTIENRSVPTGVYKCVFDRIEENEHEKFGRGWKWCFIIMEGPHKDEEVYRTTKDYATPKNSCGRFLAALAGCTALEDKQEVETDDHIGEKYVVMVEPSPSGESTRIGSFVRADGQGVAAF